MARTDKLMTEEQYSDMHDRLASKASPWKHPNLYGQPGEEKAKWRNTVGNWLLALDKVLSPCIDH